MRKHLIVFLGCREHKALEVCVWWSLARRAFEWWVNDAFQLSHQLDGYTGVTRYLPAHAHFDPPGSKTLRSECTHGCSVIPICDTPDSATDLFWV